jgi:uncharacterized protein YdhG (YjbR/CyaY superfamily)
VAYKEAAMANLPGLSHDKVVLSGFGVKKRVSCFYPSRKKASVYAENIFILGAFCLTLRRT